MNLRLFLRAFLRSLPCAFAGHKWRECAGLLTNLVVYKCERCNRQDWGVR